MSVNNHKAGNAKQRDPVPLGRAAARLAKHVEKALSQSDLSLPQYRVLLLLGDGSAVASALASKLAVSPPSVTAIVDGLVARGLVNRLSDGGDRRRVTHALTDKGRQVLSEADAETNTRLEAIADHLAPRDRERAREGLRLWREAMDAHLSASIKS
jgi:long-chain acyl-CoA synthetase